MEKKQIEWSDELECFLKELGEKASAYYVLHKTAQSYYNKLATAIDIPVIVLSTIAGTLSIGQSSLFGENSHSNVFIGATSICVGILNTINTYFGFNQRTENHRICSIQYSKLNRFISVELRLKREQRIDPNDMLKIVKEQYDRLIDISPLIPIKLISQFKSKYKPITFSIPEECNGIKNIEIYSPREEKNNEIILNKV
jgi:hypothetical protein